MIVQKKRNLSFEKLSRAARIFKIVAHPLRLEILELLEQTDVLDVSSIKASVSQTVEQSMLSHHLTKMRDNGILHSEKKGKHKYYSIADRRILKIFDCIEHSDSF